jgi:excisionase family DNA binding protein
MAKKTKNEPQAPNLAGESPQQPPSPAESPEVMTVKQAAEYLQVNDQVLYRYVREDKVPVARMGTTIRFKKSVLDRWLESESWKSIGMEPSPSGDLRSRFKPSRPSLPMELD